MILNISDPNFKNIFQDESLLLPIRWSGEDFLTHLDNLFNTYFSAVKEEYSRVFPPYDAAAVLRKIRKICNSVKRAVKHYLDGFPATAYKTLSKLMPSLQETPLKVYKKSCTELWTGRTPNLFRVSRVDRYTPYGRTRIFHTPYNLRSKVSSCRYSIAGFPSLYLGTSLALCCEEIQYIPPHGFAIASRFEFERNFERNHTEIDVIELAIKPQDFFEGRETDGFHGRIFDEINLRSPEVRKAYLLWYPLIAASSFIRADKSDPFAPEYIVPQLLMQWVRNEMADCQQYGYNRLIGIRYFSCASVRASDLGFNYVFPVSGKAMPSLPYCPVLAESFKVTVPQFINDYSDLDLCEYALKCDRDLKFIHEV